MKIKLLVNLKVDDQTWVAGTYDSKVTAFPQKLQNEVDAHRKGKQPRTTLQIIEDDAPAVEKNKRSTSRRSRSNK